MGVKRHSFISIVIFTLAVLGTSCTTNYTSRSSLGSSGTGVAAPINQASNAFNLTRVLRSSNVSKGTFDLIDDGSGAIGQYCVSTATTGGNGTVSTNQNTQPGNSGQLAGGGAASSSTNCACNYSYTTAAGTLETFDFGTVYNENDLIRCQIPSVPAGIATLNVSVHLMAQDIYSNKIAVKLLGTGVGFDSSLASNFAFVQRYQCRDVITIPYLLDPGTDAANVKLYDPLQSEDPELTYPLNFFTTNFGKSIDLYGNSKAFGFNCPALPNDPAAGLNLTIYSIGADAAGSKQIFPVVGSVFDRNTFYVSKLMGGVFQLPLSAYFAPANLTQPPNADGTALPPQLMGPLGYAASPISAGTGKETCPDSSVAIPAGYHWAKLWLFRADLPQRKFIASPDIPVLASVTCNPGLFATGQPPFPDCGTAGGIKALRGDPVLATPDRLADRVLGTSMCVQFDTLVPTLLTAGRACNDTGRIQAPGCTTSSAAGNPQAPLPAGVYSKYPPGADLWFPKSLTAGGVPGLPTPASCNPTAPNDPFHLCTNIDHVPFSTNISLFNVDTTANPRFDFIFVVTPPTVMSSDMTNSSSTVNYPYTPYRFFTSTDCQSADPDNPNPGDCKPNKTIHYGLKLHDVRSNGDPPATPSTTDPTNVRAGVFPMCVIQPN